MLKLLIEERRSGQALIAEGFAPALVERVERMLRRAEFKRRQSPPLLKVEPAALALDGGCRLQQREFSGGDGAAAPD